MVTGPQPAQRLDIQLVVATEAVPGPDGQPWVVLTLRLGLSVHQMVMPESLAEQAGPLLAQKLAEGAAAARRARIGIILPSQQPQPPPNGGPVRLSRLPELLG